MVNALIAKDPLYSLKMAMLIENTAIEAASKWVKTDINN
jgi:hypothetical protein